MTGPEHYRESERLLDRAEELETGPCAVAIAAAQAHATLALAAATAYPAVRDYCGEDVTTLSGWAKAAIS